MQDWVDELDNQILFNRKKILEGNGNISHEEEKKSRKRIWNIYRKRNENASK